MPNTSTQSDIWLTKQEAHNVIFFCFINGLNNYLIHFLLINYSINWLMISALKLTGRHINQFEWLRGWYRQINRKSVFSYSKLIIISASKNIKISCILQKILSQLLLSYLYNYNRDNVLYVTHLDLLQCAVYSDLYQLAPLWLTMWLLVF